MFTDFFQSGDRSHTENGISWGGNTPNVVVTTANPYNSGVSPYSVLMPFGPDTVPGVPNECNSEQDVLFSTPMTEFWAWYPLFVAANYYHRDGTEPEGPSPTGTYNNKGFLYAWNGAYDGATQPTGNGPGIGPNLFPDSALPNIVLQPGEDRQKCYLFNGYGLGGGSHFDQFLDGGNPALMAYGLVQADYGKWCEIVTHVKYATAANNDGVYQNWIRPAGAGSYTKLLNFTNVAMYVASATGFDHLRILGYSNSGFKLATNLYVGGLKIAATNIFGVS